MLFRLLEVALAAALLGQTVADQVGCTVANGACASGSYLHEVSAASLAECQQNCRDTQECNFYTYYTLSEECFEYTACHDFSYELCPDDCLSGSVDCICRESGECRGEQIGVSFVNEDTCIEHCYGNPDCNWWNHYTSDNLCMQLSNCSFIDNVCTDCIHGEKACYQQALQDVEVLFVTSGYNEQNLPNPAVDLIPLDAPEVVCPAVPDIPYAEWNGYGFVHEREPVVCAMYENRHCYKFDTASWTWQEYAETTEVRDRASGTAWKQDYMLLGGYNSQTMTEIFNTENETWATGPRFIYDVWSACAANYKNERVFLTGGYNDDDLSNVLVLHVSDESWSYLPDLNTPRNTHICGIAKAADGTSALIVSGGYNNLDGHLFNTEIFDLDSGATSWRSGIDLPSGPIEEAYSLPYKDSFLVIGGTPDDAQLFTSIWQYDPNNSTMPWILRPEELSVGRQNGPVAILMKANDLNCTPPA